MVEVTRPSADCQTTFFGRFKQLAKFLKKVAERSRDSGRRSRDRRPTVKQRFLDVSSNKKIFWKKSLNGHATVVGGHATVGRLSNNVFWTFQAIWENFEKSRWTVATVIEVTRPSADCQTTFFGRFKQLAKFFEKSRWTVTRQWSEVTRPADCQRFLDVSSGKIFWTVTRQWLRSRDRRPTVKQRFLDVSKNFRKKSLNGHATVVGGHATVGRLSNNVFWTFQAIGNFYEKKGHATICRSKSLNESRESSGSERETRPSADCQTTTIFWTSSFQPDNFLVCRSQRLSGKFFPESFDMKISRIGPFLSLNGHATVVWGHATVGRLSNNVFWTFQAIWENFEKSRWTVTRQWSEVTRPSADCQTTFFGRFKRFGKYFEKSRWTVTRQWSEVTRPSADCQTTFSGRFKRFGKILKKVAERSRDSGRRSRDRRPTVKQRFLDVSSN